MANFNLGSLVWLITGDTSKLDSSIQATNKKLDQLSKRAGDVGKSLTLKLTLPLAAIGGVALKTAADIETQRVAFGVLCSWCRALSTLKGSSLLHRRALDLRQYSHWWAPE